MVLVSKVYLGRVPGKRVSLRKERLYKKVQKRSNCNMVLVSTKIAQRSTLLKQQEKQHAALDEENEGKC